MMVHCEVRKEYKCEENRKSVKIFAICDGRAADVAGAGVVIKVRELKMNAYEYMMMLISQLQCC